MDLAFTNLLPGDPQTVSVAYQNTGLNPEDVWITFPNATALSALNDLGRYGTVHLTSSGYGAVGDVFDSANLNDNSTTCGPFSQSPGQCWPLPAQLQIASNVTPGNGGTFSFSFMYASKLSTQAPGAPWNTYPVPAGPYSASNTNGQFTVNASDGTGAGLPYDIVATQVGILPGAAGTLP
jgi:hypothetical protein